MTHRVPLAAAAHMLDDSDGGVVSTSDDEAMLEGQQSYESVLRRSSVVLHTTGSS